MNSQLAPDPGGAIEQFDHVSVGHCGEGCHHATVNVTDLDLATVRATGLGDDQQ